VANLDTWIDRINSNDSLTQAQKQRLRQQARDLANNKGRLNADDRAAMNASMQQAEKAYNQLHPGLEGNNSGGGGGGGGEDGEDGTITTTACHLAIGPPRDGYRWEGAVIKNADGTISNTCRQVPIEEEEDEPEDTSARDANRRMARDEFRAVLEGMGFTTAFGFTQAEIDSLFSSVESWIGDGWADGYDGGEKLLMKFRTSDQTKAIYQKRFGGMAELASRGMAISEGEYINLERSYRNVMSNYGLPSTYYDTFDDYARLIGAGLSVNEVEQRVVAAKQAMNPLVAAELKQYYNVGDGDLTAYMLGLTDENGLKLASARNQEEIRQRGRLGQIGAAAERAGFSMDRSYAERLAGTSIGQTIDPFQMETLAQLEGTFDRSRRIADRETTLAGIDRETYDQRDALAAAFGDQQATLASEKRAKRERARFAGSGGASSGSLSVQRNF